MKANLGRENTTMAELWMDSGCLVGLREAAVTLHPLLSQHVRPEVQFSVMNGAPVDPTTGAHTQSVEAMWNCCKRMMQERKVMNSALFETYLPEFMWRKRFGGPIAFGNILKHIAQHYPV